MSQLTNRQKKNLAFAGLLLFSVVIPSLAVAIKYGMIQAFFRAPDEVKLSIMGMLLISTIVLVNLKKINEALHSPPFTVLKAIINGILKGVPLVAVFTMLVFMEDMIDDLKFVYYWFFGCNMISLLVFEPLWRFYNNEFLFDYNYAKYEARRSN